MSDERAVLYQSPKRKGLNFKKKKTSPFSVFLEQKRGKGAIFHTW